MPGEKLDFPFDAPTDYTASVDSCGEEVQITPETTVILEFEEHHAQYNHCRATKEDGGVIFLKPDPKTIQSMKASGFAVERMTIPDERTIEYYNYSYSDFWKETS